MLVVNCDFRRPAIHQYFGIADEPRRVHETSIAGVKVVTNVLSDPGANPSQVVAAQRQVIDARARPLRRDPARHRAAAHRQRRGRAGGLRRPRAARRPIGGDDASTPRPARVELLNRLDAPLGGVVLAGVKAASNDYYYYYQPGRVESRRATHRCRDGRHADGERQRRGIRRSRRRVRRRTGRRPADAPAARLMRGAARRCRARARRGVPGPAGSPAHASRSRTASRGPTVAVIALLACLGMYAWGWLVGGSAVGVGADRDPAAPAAHHAAVHPRVARGARASTSAGCSRSGLVVRFAATYYRFTHAADGCVYHLAGAELAKSFRHLDFGADPGVPGARHRRHADHHRRRRGVHQLELVRHVPRVRVARVLRLLPVLPGVRDRAARRRPPALRAARSSSGPRWCSGRRASARTAGCSSPSASPSLGAARVLVRRPGGYTLLAVGLLLGELRAAARVAAVRRSRSASRCSSVAGPTDPARSRRRWWPRSQGWSCCSRSAAIS